MTTYPIIKRPEFIDLEKSRVRMILVAENGVETNAEIDVPKNRERGVSELWDRIMDEHDVEAMRKARNDLETRRRRDAEFQDKKRKAAIQNDILKQLFDAKTRAFELPFVQNATPQNKAAVRRAPSVHMLNMVLAVLCTEYMKDTGKSFIDIFDEIEDLQFAKEKKKNEPENPA